MRSDLRPRLSTLLIRIKMAMLRIPAALRTHKDSLFSCTEGKSGFVMDMTNTFRAQARALKKKFDRHVTPDGYFVSRQYHRRHGFFPNLREPKDLSEKVQWLKLHDRSPLHTQCADKIRARDYVASRLGSDILVPAIRISFDPADINPEMITADRFVIKTNHDQGGVFICRDRASFDWEGVREKVSRRLQLNKYYDFREYQYKHVRPGILVENFVEGDHEGNVREMKFYCFHGQPKFAQVVLDRFENRREVFYDADWKRMHFRGPAPQLEGELEPPAGYDQLLRDAATLADPFLFCRIDFLLGAGDRPWFGEITFHHGAGLIRFKPDPFERAFGEMIDLGRLPETQARQQKLIAAQLAKAAPLTGGRTNATAG